MPPPKPDRNFDFRPTEESPAILHSRNVAVPLWAAITMVITAVGATIWLLSTLESIKYSIREVADSGRQSWRSDHQREFVRIMQRENPTIKVPDSDQIIRDFDRR